MTFIDEYRRSWALRYLREARAELKVARTMPETASNAILNALRKAQAAIYHSLGDPSSIEDIVHEKIVERGSIEDPVLRCLVEIEMAIQRIVNLYPVMGKKSFREAENLIRIASEVVKLFSSERED